MRGDKKLIFETLKIHDDVLRVVSKTVIEMTETIQVLKAQVSDLEENAELAQKFLMHS